MSSIFSSPNDLEEVAFIGGTEMVLTFLIYDSGSAALNLSGCTCTWELARYGDSASILSKTAVVSGSPINQMVVTLESADTQSLYGTFTQQPVIVDASSSEFRPSQGIVKINPRNS